MKKWVFILFLVIGLASFAFVKLHAQEITQDQGSTVSIAWEYKYIYMPNTYNLLLLELNKAGKLGWEMVSYSPSASWQMQPIIVWMKRPVAVKL